MKKRTLAGLLLACLLVLSGCLPSSSPPDNAPSPPASSSPAPSSSAPKSKPSPSETWGETGSAKTLTGSTLVVNLFLSDAQSQWDSQSRTDAMEMLEEAFVFLTEEAARYGQEIRLTQTDKLASYYLTFDQAVEDNLEYYWWTDEMLPQNGFADFAALLEDAVKQAGETYDNVAAIVHLNKPGRSYALPFLAGNEEKYQAEHLVMFFNEDASHPYYICPAAYAHELLHLFGARDLYDPDGQNAAVKDLAQSVCEDDIMLSISSNLYNHQVEGLTAYSVGWLGELPEEFLPLEEVLSRQTGEEENHEDLQSAALPGKNVDGSFHSLQAGMELSEGIRGRVEGEADHHSRLCPGSSGAGGRRSGDFVRLRLGGGGKGTLYGREGAGA